MQFSQEVITFDFQGKNLSQPLTWVHNQLLGWTTNYPPHNERKLDKTLWQAFRFCYPPNIGKNLNKIVKLVTKLSDCCLPILEP
jgi:hypothetical protein